MSQWWCRRCFRCCWWLGEDDAVLFYSRRKLNDPTGPQELYSRASEWWLQNYLSGNESGGSSISLGATGEELGFGRLVIRPDILLSFWTKRQDERFRLSPLVSEGLLSFFSSSSLSLSLSSIHLRPPLFVSRYLSLPDSEREKSSDDYFTRALMRSLWVFLTYSHLHKAANTELPVFSLMHPLVQITLHATTWRKQCIICRRFNGFYCCSYNIQ